MSVDPRWSAARRILAVRLDNLGDVLMTTPALAAVRCGLPDAHLTLLTSRAGAALAPALPGVDAVQVWDAPWVQGPGSSPADERRFIARLARQRFDAAIVFTVCTQSALPAALACRLAGIPLRLAHARENPYQLLTDWVRDTERVEDGMRHEVERQVDLVRAVGFSGDAGPLRLCTLPADRLSLGEKARAVGLDLRAPCVVVHPGATAASRRYAPERFADAADAIQAASGCTVVWAGGPAEQSLVEAARQRMRAPSCSLAGALSLGELAALIEAADVLVCNNSGPAHMAAALGTPVVVLYALTNPQHTPWRVPAQVLSHDVPCRNCLKSVCPQGHNDCLAQVSPGAVADAALRLLHLPSAAAA